MVFLGSKFLSSRYFLGVIQMPGIFVRIQVFLRVMKHDFAKKIMKMLQFCRVFPI